MSGQDAAYWQGALADESVQYSEIYGEGKSESIIGQLRSETDPKMRDRLYIASKCKLKLARMSPGEVDDSAFRFAAPSPSQLLRLHTRYRRGVNPSPGSVSNSLISTRSIRQVPLVLMRTVDPCERRFPQLGGDGS